MNTTFTGVYIIAIMVLPIEPAPEPLVVQLFYHLKDNKQIYAFVCPTEIDCCHPLHIHPTC